NVTFEFSSLEFSDPESIRYAYRLDPHDEQWIEASASHRLATYTDLHAGEYRLRVRASRQGAPWGDNVADLALRVLPAPWASPAAYAVYALALIALAAMTFAAARAALHRRTTVQETIRRSAERLKLALWGSGAELWDVDMTTGRMVRENRLAHLAA